MRIRLWICTALAAAGILVSPHAIAAAGMDGHWSGMLGSSQADVVISGQAVTYSYGGSGVPVSWSKVSAATASFGNALFKMTLKKDGSASFESSKFGNASGTFSRQ